MSFFARPIFALGFAAFLVCADACLHLGDWLSLPGHWTSLPSLLDDWPAAIFLVFGAVRSRRDWVLGRPYQAAAWGFNSSLLFGSLVGSLEDWSSSQPPVEGWIPRGAFVVTVGIVFALTLCGLVSTLALTSPPWRRADTSRVERLS